MDEVPAQVGKKGALNFLLLLWAKSADTIHTIAGGGISILFNVALYTALVIFGLGLCYKISTWFRYSLSIEAAEISASRRVTAAVKGIFLTFFSKKIVILARVFVLDVLLQTRTLKESFPRWLMHIGIFGGFMLLLMMHALEGLTTSKLFPDYSSTLNPFLFLRNLFLAAVLFGLGMAVFRRFFSRTPRLRSNAMDRYSLIVLAVIMVSGLLLEGAKIVSYTSYRNMVEDYADLEEEGDEEALESLWVDEFGIVSPRLKGPFDKGTLTRGREIHDMNCAACHSRPQWAFLSYGVSRTIKPVSHLLDKANVARLLWYVHFLISFFGLAYLPFSKMLHIIAGPLCLLANAVIDHEESDPANIATLQILELDACTHCGTCSVRCSVGIVFEEIHNVNILPSEKIASAKALAAGNKLSEEDLKRIQEGLHLCTNCYRCTEVCPVGINLQEMWFNVREKLLQSGTPELLALCPLSLYRGLRRDEMGEDQFSSPLNLAREAIANEYISMEDNGTISSENMDREFQNKLAESSQSSSFVYCFSCMTCSSSCPVFLNYENPPKSLGLAPHQIIRAAAMGLPELTFRSKMLWSCLGCYQCQDNCPQGVCLADIFYELKNLAVEHFKERN